MRHGAWLPSSLLLLILLPRSARPESGPIPSAPDPVTKIAAGAVNSFAFDLYAQLVRPTGNLFLSPYDVHQALAMACTGARGGTERDLLAVLHAPAGRDTLARSCAALRRAIEVRSPDEVAPIEEGVAYARPRRSTGSGFGLQVSNAIWAAPGLEVRPAFSALQARMFGAPMRRADFSRPGVARRTINAWVSERTNRRIPAILSPGDLGRETGMVIASAIYFRAYWRAQFRKAMTAPATFWRDGRDATRAPFMHRTIEARYLADSAAQVLQLPYRDGAYAMWIALPRHREDVARLERRIGAETLAGWRARASQALVELSLPRFEVRFRSELNSALKAMGAGSAFAGADFSGIADADLFVSHVLHEAWVRVDEEGTEAAAAAAVVLEGETIGEPPRPIEFRADHPFLFFIVHEPTGAILFMGRLADPSLPA